MTVPDRTHNEPRAPAHVVLVGLMGVGKTTVGRALATALSRPLSDSDEVITRRCGSTVRDLNERLGTEAMHQLEARHLLEALADPAPSVIGAAASVVDDERCRRALRGDGVFTVWLRGRPETLAGRFSAGPHRPVLDSNAEALFRRQIRERARRFAAVADLRIEVEGRSPPDIAAEVLRAFTDDT